MTSRLRLDEGCSRSAKRIKDTNTGSVCEKLDQLSRNLGNEFRRVRMDTVDPRLGLRIGEMPVGSGNELQPGFRRLVQRFNPCNHEDSSSSPYPAVDSATKLSRRWPELRT